MLQTQPSAIDPMLWLEDHLYKWGAWREPGRTGASSLGYTMSTWVKSAGLPSSVSSRPERSLANDQLMSALDRAISSDILTPAQRRCVEARYSSMPSVPAASLAISLNLSARTVREHLQRALANLLPEIAKSEQAAWLREVLPTVPASPEKACRP